MKINGKYLAVVAAMCGLSAATVGLITNVAGLFFAPMAEEFGIMQGAASLMLTIANICMAVGGLATRRLAKVLPLKVLFTAKDNGDKACLWMTDGNTLMQGRDFDALFSLRDIRRSYSSISDANWRRIVNGQVAEGMTKEECRLAKGAPKSIRQLPDQRGLREYWLYDGGAYLYFVDGILTNNRK